MDIKENKIGHFECVCNSRNHLIRATHYNWSMPDDEDKKHEVNFEFILHNSDYIANKNYYGDDDFIKELWLEFTNIFRRLWWRFKTALKIMAFGKIETTDNWMATEDGFIGLKKWINKTAEIIKDDNGRIA